MPKSPHGPDSPDPIEARPNPVSVLLEEYRQVYTLAHYRLEALDLRVPIAGSVLTGALGSVAALPTTLQPVLLVGLPLTVLWFVRTTIQHALSFEDALRRIEEIERSVNSRTNDTLMTFQSSHPSKGRYVGGRTGARTVQAALIAALMLLAGCGYMFALPATSGTLQFTMYIAYLTAIGIALNICAEGYRRYRR